jgi:rhodanese-related sulfurtransferase
MAQIVERDEIRKLAADGAQVVEVLSTTAYETLHLAGAVNLPLARLDRQAAGRLDRHRAVVVYCADRQ